MFRISCMFLMFHMCQMRELLCKSYSIFSPSYSKKDFEKGVYLKNKVKKDFKFFIVQFIRNRISLFFLFFFFCMNGSTLKTINGSFTCLWLLSGINQFEGQSAGIKSNLWFVRVPFSASSPFFTCGLICFIRYRDTRGDKSQWQSIKGWILCLLLSFASFDHTDGKHGADRDETPPRTPTGNAPSSESDLEVSSSNNETVTSNDIIVSQEEDERLAKELSLKEAAAHDLSHRPKRRRFHESYNFNMKCPTPGCNSLGERPNADALVWGWLCTNIIPFISVSGHLTGRHERHFSISGCPLYHNLSADECKVQHRNAAGHRMLGEQQQTESRMWSYWSKIANNKT